MRLLAIVGILFIHSAFAESVIITHADLRYDFDASAGQATHELLADNSFVQKLVLVPVDGIENFTFDPSGLDFLRIPSQTGEVTWDYSDSKLVMAGGYWYQCFSQSVAQVISNSPGDVNIEISMRGTYSFLNDIGAGGGVMNLSEIELLIGKDKFKRAIRGFVDIIRGSRARLIVQLRGQTLFEEGTGHRQAHINFF